MGSPPDQTRAHGGAQQVEPEYEAEDVPDRESLREPDDEPEDEPEQRPQEKSVGESDEQSFGEHHRGPQHAARDLARGRMVQPPPDEVPAAGQVQAAGEERQPPGGVDRIPSMLWPERVSM